MYPLSLRLAFNYVDSVSRRCFFVFLRGAKSKQHTPMLKKQKSKTFGLILLAVNKVGACVSFVIACFGPLKALRAPRIQTLAGEIVLYCIVLAS